MTWSGVAQLFAKGRHSGIKTKTKKESPPLEAEHTGLLRLATTEGSNIRQKRENTDGNK